MTNISPIRPEDINWDDAPLGDDFPFAVLLWCVGGDTLEIAERLQRPQSAVHNALPAIRDAARQVKAGRR